MTWTNEPGVHGVSSHACRSVIALKSFVFSSSTSNTYTWLAKSNTDHRQEEQFYFFRHMMATIGDVRPFIHPFDKIALNGSCVLLTLQDLAFSHNHGIIMERCGFYVQYLRMVV